MATTRSRHMITESDELEFAIDQVLSQSPLPLTRAAALRLILQRGISSLNPAGLALRDKRLEAVDQASGILDGVWNENWKAEMLSEWPE
ncbi:MAG: hypothetical protein RJA26_432 [Actinomycetota bacterium]